MKLVFLEITSWVGTSAIGASHYYGRLIAGSYRDKDRTEVEVTDKLTTWEAKELNKRDREMGFADSSFKYKKGQESNHFWSEEDVVAAAKRMFAERFPDEDAALIKGLARTLDPRPVLAGPEDFVKRANAINAKAEAIDYWDGGKDAEMEVLYKEWNVLKKEFGAA